MNQLRPILTVIAIAAANISAVAIAQNAAAKLVVNFTGVEENEGAILAVLFDSEAAYNGGKPVRQMMVTADKPDVSALLEGLAPGRYAIKSFHDVDGDQKMGTNPYGMPTEPFAFSNNAVGNMGPAQWADTAFEIKAGDNVHSISIK
jgi:uncharacterized protein (DUF2141 family)